MSEPLYPEGSITRRINRENVLLLGGGRALLMQLAHPKVAQGVDEHSDFREQPMRRLRRTIRMVMAIVFGDRETAMAAARSVNLVHSDVRGDGYRAMDPDLLLWVHTTLVDSALFTYQTFVKPLNNDELETFYQESKLVGELLGIPRDTFPDRYADFQGYTAAQLNRGPVQVSPLALDLGKLVLRPRLMRLPGPAFLPWEFITAGLLPPPLREQYRLSWGPRHERMFRLFTIAVPRLVSVTPPMIRVWPLPGRNVRLGADFSLSS